MTNNSIANLSVAQLKKVIAVREKIETLERQLATLSGSEGGEAVVAKKGRRKRRGGMSAAGRARVGAAARKRWAKLKKEKAGKEKAVPAGKAPKRRRKMSAAAKAKIAAAARARWARIREARAAK